MEVQQSANNLFPLKQHNTGSYSQVGDATMPVNYECWHWHHQSTKTTLHRHSQWHVFFFSIKERLFFFKTKWKMDCLNCTTNKLLVITQKVIWVLWSFLSTSCKLHSFIRKTKDMKLFAFVQINSLFAGNHVFNGINNYLWKCWDAFFFVFHITHSMHVCYFPVTQQQGVDYVLLIWY